MRPFFSRGFLSRLAQQTASERGTTRSLEFCNLEIKTQIVLPKVKVLSRQVSKKEESIRGKIVSVFRAAEAARR